MISPVDWRGSEGLTSGEASVQAILGDSKRQVVENFAEAAKIYEHNPVAFHLRAMNMLYEGLKENSTIVIVPSTAVESMQLGGLAGMTALTMGLGQDRANGHKEGEIKKQIEDTVRVKEILNGTEPKTSP